MQRIGSGKKYKYLEYHSVCPLVRIGTPHPLSRERVYSPPESKGGEHTRLLVRGWAGPNSDGWRKSLTLCLLCMDSCLAVIAGG
jgi:hypothetical protein